MVIAVPPNSVIYTIALVHAIVSLKFRHPASELALHDKHLA